MKRKTAIYVVVILLVILFLGAGFLLLSVEKGKNAEEEGEQVHIKEQKTIHYQGKTYVYNENLETILWIGLDGVTDSQQLSYNNQVQSDYVTLLLFDHDKKKINIIQLNRDTICDIPILDLHGQEDGVNEAQLALAHTYGSGEEDSCRNVVKTVKNLLYDINVDHFFSMPIDTVATLNDAVGGVTVTLEDDFTFADPKMTAGTTLTLQGQQAVSYVRSRKEMEDATNIARMARQKTYMQEWVKVAKPAYESNQDILMNTLLKISEDLVSDMSVYSMADLLECALDYEVEEIISPKGEAEMLGKNMAFYVDEDALMDLVVEKFYIEEKE